MAPLSAQTYDWVQIIRPGGNEHPWDLAIDNYGHLYATGRVKFKSIFGSGANVDTLMGIGGETDVFVAKYKLNGEFVWARRDGGVQGDWGRAIATDRDGSVLVTGEYCDTAMFGTHQLIAKGTVTTRNFFVAKYDSSGNCLWAKTAGYTSPHSRGWAIVCDSLNNVYVGGNISGPSNFDSKTFGVLNKNLPFLAKFDPNGNCIWVKTLAAQYNGEVYDLKIGKSGLLYTTGRYTGTLTINGTTYAGNSPSWGDVFIARLDTAGTFQWVKTANGTFQDMPYALDLDANENIYVAGTFANDLNFSGTVINAILPGATAAAANAAADIFVAKYNSAGTFQWVRTAGGTKFDLAEDLSVTPSGKVLIAATVEDSVAFGPYTLQTINDTINNLVLCYDSLGNIEWYETHGGTMGNSCHSVIADQYSNVYMAGAWEGNATYDGFNLVGTNGYDGLIAKIIPPLDPIVSLSKLNGCEGDSVAFSVIQDGSPLTYEWSFAGTSPSTANTASGTNVYDSAGTYAVQLIISNPYESDTVNQSVIINTNPVVSLGTDTMICEENPYTFSPGSFAAYQWSNGSSASSITVNGTGNYSVVVTDANGCQASDTAFVDVQVCISVEEIAANSALLYPNPVKNILTVTVSDFTGRVFSLYNTVGQKAISDLYLEGSHTTIDLDLAPGIYYYTISAGGEQGSSGKLIVE